jgi:hypothetical protein
MSDSSLIFPDGFEQYARELESKGYFSEARLEFQGRRYQLTFYDPARLGQDIEEVLQRGGIFFEPNLVVVPAVTRQNMEKAATQLVKQASLGSLVAE